MTYTIKQTSEKTGLSIYTLQFYDKQGLLPFVGRNKSGARIFTKWDIFMIQTIDCLKNTNMQVKDIKKYIEYVMNGIETIDFRKNLLLEHRKIVIN